MSEYSFVIFTVKLYVILIRGDKMLKTTCFTCSQWVAGVQITQPFIYYSLYQMIQSALLRAWSLLVWGLTFALTLKPNYPF